MLEEGTKVRCNANYGGEYLHGVEGFIVNVPGIYNPYFVVNFPTKTNGMFGGSLYLMSKEEVDAV